MIRVHLDDTRELFTAPEPDPFAGRFERESGAEQIVEQAGGRGMAAPLAVHVELDRPPTHPESQVRDALDAYWRDETSRAKAARRRIWNRGLKELAVGALFLAGCLALSASLAAVTWPADWVGDFVTEGLVIIGWIALWHPVDMLLFEPWALTARLRALRRLVGSEVRVTSAGTTPA
ncbi:hypothetical protein ACFQ0P_08475 [Microbacterium insulae]|uniref:Holin of 3TMs, for gene-transfer release n=1 Tax=Microbacterium insulae TaxID=483014 RepID=A0ABW3AIK0_9MICO